jgi:hypothetical protein
MWRKKQSRVGQRWSEKPLAEAQMSTRGKTRILVGAVIPRWELSFKIHQIKRRLISGTVGGGAAPIRLNVMSTDNKGMGSQLEDSAWTVAFVSFEGIFRVQDQMFTGTTLSD